MNSADADDEARTEHRLLEYDTTVPVSRRVACSCGWEATYGAGKTALASQPLSRRPGSLHRVCFAARLHASANRGVSIPVGTASEGGDVSKLVEVEFEVAGPFPVPPKNGRRIHDDLRREFWDQSQEVANLADRRGCYVFAISKQGGGLQPWCVGRTTRGTFATECFTDHKLKHLAQLPDGGRLILFLVVYQQKPRGRPNQKGIGVLERLLIVQAEKRNPALRNRQGRARIAPRVPGVFDPARGRPRRDATLFKSMLGLPS